MVVFVIGIVCDEYVGGFVVVVGVGFEFGGFVFLFVFGFDGIVGVVRKVVDDLVDMGFFVVVNYFEKLSSFVIGSSVKIEYSYVGFEVYE